MMMFKFPMGRPDSQTMRSAAESVGVEWDSNSIVYEGDKIGFADAPESANPTPIQDALEQQLGIRPQVVTNP